MNVLSVNWSYDDKFIVSGSMDKKTKIWNFEKRKILKTF